MCGRCLLIGLIALVACCSPTLADTLNSFRNAPGLKTWPAAARAKAARCACGKILEGIAPICC
jgi:hypothetical protein